ncbi:hypothetical protein C8A00DRAFT_19142 [Chaetomidium leptoderma]|uniref:DUF7719 domain-containing protein n=1 Tax=Chaetomidium leptoderma TaxID=669021 RepID=A0AAN6ZU75_9PEZI|nr:hypothetical protein C8A00DRAFT_19142 [Chaetomidium leptoderma]
MARRRRERSPSEIKLKQPDRSDPTEKTLLQLADERGLFEQAKKREDEIGKKAAPSRIPRPPKYDDDGDDDDDDDEVGLPPGVERVFETLLWSVSLAMLHVTLDVLVQHQYSVDRILWPKIWMRFGQALLVFGLLVYFLHPHAANRGLIPGLTPRYQSALRQAIFWTTSTLAGCYLIHITNTSGYMAVMKQAPPIGCLWVWSVIELDLPWAVLSLAGAGTFLWQKGYSIK